MLSKDRRPNNSTLALILVVALILAAFNAACDQLKESKQTPLNNSNQVAIKTYHGTGIITKIDRQRGSIELNHEDIPGLMPAMTMEYYVKDRALLEKIQLGDKVNFTVEETAGTEVISEIQKAVTK